MKEGMYHAVFQKREGKLSPLDSEVGLYREFVKMLDEGQRVEVFFDLEKDDGTLAQLAKLHKCIRTLAHDLGYSFEDMKIEVKRAAGLCIKKEIGGENYMICKSFGKCSKEELSLAIEAVIQIGDTTGSNLR